MLSLALAAELYKPLLRAQAKRRDILQRYPSSEFDNGQRPDNPGREPMGQCTSSEGGAGLPHILLLRGALHPTLNVPDIPSSAAFLRFGALRLLRRRPSPSHVSPVQQHAT